MHVIDLVLQLGRLLLRDQSRRTCGIRIGARLIRGQLLIRAIRSRSRHLTLGDIHLMRPRIQTSLLPLLVQCRPLIFRKRCFRQRLGRVDFPIGYENEMPRQGRVDLRLFGRSNSRLGVLHRDRSAIRQLGVGLKLYQLVAYRGGAFWLSGERRAGGEERRGHGYSEEGLTESVGMTNVHFCSPELRCISSSRVPVLCFMSAFTALALDWEVLAAASSASARDSSAYCAARSIFLSVTAVSAEASLVRASPN